MDDDGGDESTLVQDDATLTKIDWVWRAADEIERTSRRRVSTGAICD